MKKRMTKSLLMISAIAIAMTSLVACNTNEDDAVKVTPTPVATATVDTGNPTTDVSGTTDTIVDASATPDIENTPENTPNTDVTAIPNTETNPSMTPDAQTTVSAMVTGDTTVTPNTTVEATEKPNVTGATTAKPTSTQKPTATVKPSATKAPTKKPTATATKKPTATPKKTATATKKPTATKTPTPKPTATTQKTVYQTIEFEGKTYKVLMGRNGNPNLIKDYSTLPKTLQAYAYPTFDKNAVMMDIYKYAKTKGFKYFYNPNVPLLKESSIGDTDYPKSFVPGGNMTADLAEEAFSWYSPSIVSYLGDSAYTGDYEYTELDDIIYMRQSGFSKINFLAERNKTSLCLWISDYGDSSYRKTYWDNGLYNGKITKEYALYFMYGGCTDLVQEINI